MDHAQFVAEQTALATPPLVPEITLHLASDAMPLWHMTEAALDTRGLPPPFWAFAWAGGQAVARYILDEPDAVRGLRVLDVGAGCGIGAIAAVKAGALAVDANEVDPFAIAAIGLNAAANHVTVRALLGDCLDETPQVDVVLVGDLFYERALAERAHRFLVRAANVGAATLIGDPSRTYLPRGALEEVATFAVPTPRALEDAEVKQTSVWRLAKAA
ncbi:MAG: 50S ribosomal protein L11 methyltransferase [Pseudomonadota bacterium]